jgi:hypothetical protein
MQLQVAIRLLSMILLTPLLILTGCDTAGSEMNRWPVDFSRFSRDSTQLVGRWEWEQSVYPLSGDDPSAVTPAMSDRTETLVFPTPDSVEVYRSDTLARRTTREAFLEDAKWGVHDDTLATSTAFRDGPLKIYERVE